MNSKELNRYKELLLEELQKIKKPAPGDFLTSTDDDDVQDLVDMASATTIKMVEQGLSATDAERVRQIEEALKKIKAGDYGICAVCGKTIEKDRLDFLPHAAKCITCKNQERK